MEKLLTLFPAANLRFAEARLVHFAGPESSSSEIPDTHVEEAINNPDTITDTEVRSRILQANNDHVLRVAGEADGNKMDESESHKIRVDEVRTALREARERAAKEATEAQTPETETPPTEAQTPETETPPTEARTEEPGSFETINGVTVERAKGIVSTTDEQGKSYNWPNMVWSSKNFAVLHTERAKLPDGTFAEGEATVDGQKITVKKSGNGVETKSPDGRGVKWMMANLDPNSYAKLHSVVSNFDTAPTGQTEQVAKKQAAEKLQKNAKEAVEAGRLSPKLEELAKVIAELIKVLIEKIKGPGSVRTETGPGRPGEQASNKVADGARKEVADDLAKLRDKKESGTEMTDKERTQLREQYEGEKKSNDAAIGKIKAEMPKVVQEEQDLTKSVEQQKKDIAAAKEKNPNDPDIVRMESNLKRTEQTLKEVTDHKGRLEAQQKKLEDRNKVLDDKLKAIEKPKTPEELVKSIQEIAKSIEGVKIEADLTKTPPSIAVEFKTKPEADTFRTKIKDTLAAAGSAVAVEIKPVE